MVDHCLYFYVAVGYNDQTFFYRQRICSQATKNRLGGVTAGNIRYFTVSETCYDHSSLVGTRHNSEMSKTQSSMILFDAHIKMMTWFIL